MQEFVSPRSRLPVSNASQVRLAPPHKGLLESRETQRLESGNPPPVLHKALNIPIHPTHQPTLKIQPELKIGAVGDSYKQEVDQNEAINIPVTAPPIVQLKLKIDAVGDSYAQRTTPLKMPGDIYTSGIKGVNQTGLPDGLKAGIEDLSGITMNDVRVHYNSTKPAQVQALAYTQGTDIHLGVGQEQHLHHEAWHVVQQKQGRVNPTMQANGFAINDNQVLEQEADVMGDYIRSANQKFGQRILPHESPYTVQRLTIPTQETVQPTTGDVIQRRLVTQIIPDEKDNEVIGDVLIIGRPDKVFGGSMGDHTTAFAVHAEGLKVHLKNKNYAEAIGILNYFVSATNNLPGMAGLVNLKGKERGKTVVQLPPDHLKKLQDAWTQLRIVRESIPKLPVKEPISTKESISTEETKPDSAEVALALQEYVNAYLSFRELIPLSVINIAAKSTGLAGKGKGESGPAAVLSAHERGEEQEPLALQAAIKGVFDEKAVALVAAEQDEALLQRMVPGFDSTFTIEDRIEIIVEQHLKSIEIMFPKAFKDSVITSKQMVDSVIPWLTDRLEKDRKWYEEEIGKAKCRREIAQNLAKGEENLRITEQKEKNRKKPNLPQKYEKDKLAEVERENELIKDYQARIKATDDLLTKYPVKSPESKASKEEEGSGEKMEITSEEPKSTEEGGGEAKSSHGEVPGEKMEITSEKPKSTEEGEGEEAKLAHGEMPGEKMEITSEKPKSTEEGEGETKSTYKKEVPESKMEVKEEDAKLSSSEESEDSVSIEDVENAAEDKLEVEERKQPLATQIILDHKTQEIRDVHSGGRSPSPFSGTMGAHTTSWIVHIDRIRKALIGQTVSKAIDLVKGDLFQEAEAMEKSLSKYFKSGDKTSTKTSIEKFNEIVEEISEAKSIAAQAFLLQRLINALLNYINSIPGATLEATDTGGKGEGRKRRVLTEQEEGTAEHTKPELQEAILGLLDVQVALEETWGALLKNHLEIIGKTYPKSLEKAGSITIKTLNAFAQKQEDKKEEKPKPNSKRKWKGKDNGKLKKTKEEEGEKEEKALPKSEFDFDFSLFSSSMELTDPKKEEDT